MHLTVDVVLNMVDDIMHEVLFQGVVSNPFVGVDLRVAADFPQDFALQGIAAHVGNNLRTDFPHIAVKQAHDDSLVHMIALERAPFKLGHLCALTLVHVGESATDEGFVYFDSSATMAHLSNRFVLHEKSDAMEHEPCTLLSDLNVAGDLITTNSILAVSDKPS